MAFIVTTKSAEISHRGSLLESPDYAKAGMDQFRIRPKHEPESPEPLKSSDLGVVATKSAETLHGGPNGVWGGAPKRGLGRSPMGSSVEPPNWVWGADPTGSWQSPKTGLGVEPQRGMGGAPKRGLVWRQTGSGADPPNGVWGRASTGSGAEPQWGLGRSPQTRNVESPICLKNK